MKLWRKINYLLWALAYGGKPLATELMLAMREETQHHPVYWRGRPGAIAHWVDGKGRIVTHKEGK